jgi:hypothetical protein
MKAPPLLEASSRFGYLPLNVVYLFVESKQVKRNRNCVSVMF